MKRADKYPETPFFKFYNANPKNRITSDCVIRAISTATEIPYNDVLTELYNLAIKTGYSPTSKQCYGKYLESLGWIKHNQPKKDDNTKYTGQEFINYINEKYYKGNYICHIGGHHITAVLTDKDTGHRIYDIWDCSEDCIGNYWTKP